MLVHITIIVKMPIIIYLIVINHMIVLKCILMDIPYHCHDANYYAYYCYCEYYCYD